MKRRHAVLFGATGLIGSLVLRRLLALNVYESITLIGRRHPEITDLRVEAITCSLDELAAVRLPHAIDDVFCCLGTTLKRAGSREAFYRVDHDFCVAAAAFAKNYAAEHFLMVSSVNADLKGISFYSQVKGQTEADVLAEGVSRVTLMQPSLLEGERDEIRFGEEIGQTLMSVIKPFVSWTQAQWLSIPAASVADAMVASALGVDAQSVASGQTVRRLRYKEIVELAKSIRGEA
ncbi:MAG: NAD(P)H-binding protein [Alcanivoracaceae bacterium]|nr:NAD(P)H-binding protein [Alcanivoracaceae bacterium]